MDNLRRILPSILLIGLVLVPGVVGAQSAYDRQTTALVPLGLPPAVAQGLSATCQNRCSGTRWADRFFSEGILNTRLAGDTSLITSGADSLLLSRLAAEGHARELILRQFLAQDDFVWRLDSLKVRSEYALSASEAQSVVMGANIPDAPVYKTIPDSYIYVVAAANETMSAGKDLLGNDTHEASASVWAAVYKLGFKSVEELKDNLREYYCGPDCKDRDARRAKFNSYQPPLQLVGVLQVSPKGSVPQSQSQDAAWTAFGGQILEELIDEGASKYTVLAVRAKVTSTDPTASKIGMKEGVKRGGRFYVYEEAQDENGETIQKRTAVVVASKVADNRTNMISRDAVTASVTATDSTTFKKVYPGGIERGMRLVEKPQVASLRLALGVGPGVGGLAEFRFESLLAGLGMPLGLKPIASVKFFADEYALGNVDLGKWRTTTYGGGLGYELLLGGGRLSIMPLAVYTIGKSAPLTGSDEGAEETPGLDFGADFGIKLSPEFELSLGWRQVNGYDPLKFYVGENPFVSKGLWSFGLRLQRGRFGLF